VLNNLAEVSRHLPPFALHTIFTSFFVSAILAVVAKAISVFVVAGSTGAAIGRTEGSSAASSGMPLDLSWLLAETERTVIWPMRLLVRRSFAKASQGNLTASSRAFAYLAQAQGILTLVQALLVLWAVGVVACTVTF
jgi:beta-lactamase regulating signal transducer with metallopeptidase domain